MKKNHRHDDDDDDDMITRVTSWSVWPHVDIKSSHFFTKVAQNRHSSLNLKMMLFTPAQNVTIEFSYFFKYICHQKSPNLVSLVIVQRWRWHKLNLTDLTSERLFGTPCQCDKIARLIFQNLAICNNQNLLNNIKMCLNRFKFFLQMLSWPSEIGQRLLNFCQSGEISPNLVTLLLVGSNNASMSWWLLQLLI